MDAGTLTARFNLVTTGFDKGIAKITRQLKGFSGSIVSLNQSVELFKTGARAMSTVSNATVGSFVKAASTAENYRLRLDTLLGSQKEGNRMFKEMAKFAGAVPYEYENIMSAATQLSGVMTGGVEEVQQWMPMITDLAAVSGLSIEETTGQIVRMYSAGAASADLFRERGITAMLGFTAGVSYSAEDTRKMLMAAYDDPASKFAGVTTRMASSWDGLISMLSDKWFYFKTTAMSDTGAFDAIKGAISEINDELQAMIDDGRLNQYANMIGEYFIAALTQVATSVKFVGNMFLGFKLIWQSLKFAWNKFAGFLQKGILDWISAIEWAVKAVNFGGIFDDQVTFMTGMRESQAALVQGMLLDGDDILKSMGETLDVTSTWNTMLEKVDNKFKSIAKRAKQPKKEVEEAVKPRPKATPAPKLSAQAKAGREKAKNMLSQAELDAGRIGLNDYAVAIDEIGTKYKELADIGDVETTRIADQWKKQALSALNDETMKKLIDMSSETEFQDSITGLTEYQQAVANINREFDSMISKDMPAELRAQAEAWRDSEIKSAGFQASAAKVPSIMQLMQGSIDEFSNVGTSALTSFFTTFMETGKLDFSELASSLLKGLQIYAAQMTAQLLMTAAYQGIMGIVSLASMDGNSGLHFAAAEEALMGAGIMGSFVAGSGLAGMAHDGMTDIPKEGTWLLDKGERVVDSDTNKDLKTFLKDGGGNTTINMPVQIHGGDEKSVMKALPEMREMVINVVSENIAGGGQIKGVIQNYT